MGQLGLGEEMVERKKPFPVGGALEDKKVVQVVCGGMHTVALTKEGRVRGGRRRGQWVTLHTLTPSLPTPFHCLSTTSHSHFLHSPTFTLHTLTPPLPAPSHCHYSHSHAITSHTLSLSLHTLTPSLPTPSHCRSSYPHSITSRTLPLSPPHRSSPGAAMTRVRWDAQWGRRGRSLQLGRWRGCRE